MTELPRIVRRLAVAALISAALGCGDRKPEPESPPSTSGDERPSEQPDGGPEDPRDPRDVVPSLPIAPP